MGKLAQIAVIGGVAVFGLLFFKFQQDEQKKQEREEQAKRYVEETRRAENKRIKDLFFSRVVDPVLEAGKSLPRPNAYTVLLGPLGFGLQAVSWLKSRLQGSGT